MDLLLCIDTSGEITYTLLGTTGGEKLAEHQSAGVESHIEELAHNVSDLFKTAKQNPASLTAIVLGVGPGSFTGLRIGAAFASGLSSALNVPVHTISSFAAKAFATSQSGICGVISDARREENFYGVYELPSMIELVSPSIWEREACREHFASQPDPKHLLDSAMHFGEGLYQLYLTKPTLFSSWGPQSVGQIELQYLRAVSAKTIAERSKEAQKRGV